MQFFHLVCSCQGHEGGDCMMQGIFQKRPGDKTKGRSYNAIMRFAGNKVAS
jgi:hypothetical protein